MRLSCLLEVGKVGCAIPRDNGYKRLPILRMEKEDTFTSSSYAARTIPRWKHPYSKHGHPSCALSTLMGAGQIELSQTETCSQE